MLERVIIVPDKDNAGISLVKERHAIERTLLEIAGGYTAERVRGAWLDNGKVYRDTSTRYTVVVDELHNDAIDGWLPIWTVALRQEALFTSKRAIEVQFVTASLADI